jgi:predicted HicB family RNase H-like nuclease
VAPDPAGADARGTQEIRALCVPAARSGVAWRAKAGAPARPGPLPTPNVRCPRTAPRAPAGSANWSARLSIGPAPPCSTGMRRWLRLMVPELLTAGFATAELGIWSPSASVNSSALPRCGRSSLIGGLAGMLQCGVPPANRLGRPARHPCKGVCPVRYHFTVSEVAPCALRGEESGEMTKNEPVQLITRVPAELRDRIKAHAALERMSMNELVARVMDAAVLKDLESVRQAAAIK